MCELVDLRGVACPMNYVCVRLALEPLAPGDELEILLDTGAAMSNVPMSLRNDGDAVLAITAQDDSFLVRVKKGDCQ